MLLQQAGIAMRHAKERHSSVGLYHPLEGERRRRRLTLATDRCRGAGPLEAPALGFIPPEELVTTAERTGLLPELTHHVLLTSLA